MNIPLTFLTPYLQTLHKWYESPDSLKKASRENLPVQLLVCMVLGVVVGAITVFIHSFVQFLHGAVFMLAPGEYLSNATHILPSRLTVVPVTGGVLIGAFLLLMRRRAREIVDPIEANAIHGGRLSVRDSLVLLVATLLSNASGGSIGMEAGYTQVGASITSRTGRYLNLRREDMRILVAAGAGAAIAAAFNAPLAGAFYGFELVLGSYTALALPQVVVCVLCSTLCMRLFGSGKPIFYMPLDFLDIPLWIYPTFILTGIMSGIIAIAVMKLVTYFEHTIRALQMPEWVRPVLGGAVLSLLAHAFPQVLGSGEGAIDNHLHNDWPFLALIGLLAAKILASSVCIGSGFRGGLFSSSLLIGCVFGQIFGTIAGIALPQTDRQMETFMLVGMGSVCASVLGAPVTVMLLVLEMTGNFPATTAVLVGILFSSVVTRHYFGYSFSTWRFHLRGLRITGAYDIGWVNELTMLSLMQKDTKIMPGSMTLTELRTHVTPGNTHPVFVADTEGNYAGVIEASMIFAHDMDDKADTTMLATLAKGGDAFLLPKHNIQRALKLFAVSQQEDLVVVESKESRKILGHVSESHMLRRYANELEARNMAQSGAATPVEM